MMVFTWFNQRRTIWEHRLALGIELADKTRIIR
jgi:hypothetical protein